MDMSPFYMFGLDSLLSRDRIVCVFIEMSGLMFVSVYICIILRKIFFTVCCKILVECRTGKQTERCTAARPLLGIHQPGPSFADSSANGLPLEPSKPTHTRAQRSGPFTVSYWAVGLFLFKCLTNALGKLREEGASDSVFFQVGVAT